MSTTSKTGKPSPYGLVEAPNDVYVDKDGHVYSGTPGSWQQRSTDGWMDASGDTAWADREAQARSAGDEAFRRLGQSAAGPGATARSPGASSP